MLRSFVIRTLLLTLSAFAASHAVAESLLYEGFNYTVGQPLANQTSPNPLAGQWLSPLAPNGSGSAGSSSPQSIIAGDINYPGASETATTTSLSVPRAFSGTFGTNTETRINIPGRPYTRAAGAAPGGPSLYFSFTMKMTSWTSFSPPSGNPSDTKNDAAAKNDTNRKGGNIAGFHGGAASTSTSMSTAGGFAAPVLIRREIDYSQMGTDGTLGTQTGFYEVGILKQFNTPTSGGFTDFATLDAAFDTDLHFGVGDTVQIVGEYDFVDTGTGGTGDIARLWINPSPGDFSLDATPSVTAPASVLNLQGALNIESFHVKGDTNTPGGFSLDNIRVGTTFADVNPAVTPSLVGDYNNNGVVDAADYVLWRRGGPLQNDPIGGPITSAQYDQWRANFGKTSAGAGSSLQAVGVPEPSTLLGLLVMATSICCVRQNRR